MRRDVRLSDRCVSLDELDILMRNTRHYEFKFTDIGPHNVQKYIDLMKLYFSFDCFEFHSLLLDKRGTTFARNAPIYGPLAGYVELGRDLLEQRLNRRAFTIVDFQGQPGGSSLSVEETFCGVDEVYGCIKASSETQIFFRWWMCCWDAYKLTGENQTDFTQAIHGEESKERVGEFCAG